MGWIYVLAVVLMVVNTAIVLWLIDRENGAVDPGPSGRRPHRVPVAPRPCGDRRPRAGRGVADPGRKQPA